MIAKLPDDLVRALEQAGDEPLPVENPHNHKRYVIVAEEAATPTIAGGEWTEGKNRRRFYLIQKDSTGTLSREEKSELSRLQQEVDVYLDQVAPLPIAETEALLEQLRKSLQKAS